jgi:hypothetical protein
MAAPLDWAQLSAHLIAPIIQQPMSLALLFPDPDPGRGVPLALQLPLLI